MILNRCLDQLSFAVVMEDMAQVVSMSMLNICTTANTSDQTFCRSETGHHSGSMRNIVERWMHTNVCYDVKVVECSGQDEAECCHVWPKPLEQRSELLG